VLLAGGSGSRAGLEYPKQFLRLGGRTVLEHTLGTFEAAACIDAVLIVCAEAWIDAAQEIVEGCGAVKVIGVIAGGRTRNHSTQAAIAYLSDERGLGDAKVLLHDAVRPLVSGEILAACAAALDEYDAVDVVTESADTIVEVRDGVLSGIPPRGQLRRGQTPQGFSLALLRAAYERLAGGDLTRFTDDCAVVLEAFPQVPILALAGSEENVKITRPIDIYIADRLLQARQDALPAPADRPWPEGAVVVIGGSSGIGAALVELLREAGRAVVALSRSEGGVDVRDEVGVARALAVVGAEHGAIAAVVNTAGTLTRGSLLELSADALRDELDVNLLGALNVARAAAPWLRESGGHLVLFTSSSYTRGRAGYAAYSATKAATVNIVQALAEEWHADGVKVNCINPARTNTPMRTKAFGVEPEATLLDAASVAQAIVAVIASEATGHVYDVRADSAACTLPEVSVARARVAKAEGAGAPQARRRRRARQAAKLNFRP
jgi:2-C-methyl-D-erythritol 4-phosphate cytidylyltransferase